MEETSGPDVSFFENLLQHKPVKSVLIKQLGLLDSLTLIRFINVSPKVAEFAKDDAIWTPRVQRKWGGKYKKQSTEFPGVLVTSYAYSPFQSAYDLFLFLSASTAHAWETQDTIINVQDWNLTIIGPGSEEEKRSTIEKLRSFMLGLDLNYYLWTEEGGKLGYEEDYRRGRAHTLGVDRFDYVRRVHFELTPRWCFWFKPSADGKDVTVAEAGRRLSRVIPFYETFWVNVQVKNDAGSPIVGAFKFVSSKFVPRDRNDKKFDRDFLELPGGTKHKELTFFPDEERIPQDFNMTIFVGVFGTVECYRLSVEVDTRKGRRFTKTLRCERVEIDLHSARSDQSEFLIDSCLTCNQPAALQCSGCNRAVYCSQECGKRAWKEEMHNLVCGQIPQ